MVLKYSYKKPGFVRMEIAKPDAGSVIIYDPIKQKAIVRPFPRLPQFFLTLSPKSRWIRSPTGHTVDQSDILALIESIDRLGKTGKLECRGWEIIEAHGRDQEDKVCRIRITLDDRLFPVHIVSFDCEGQQIEEVLLEQIEINPELETALFDRP